jgi:hypothetical protein
MGASSKSGHDANQNPVSATNKHQPHRRETMFDIKSESGENRSQSAGETLQPLPNTRAATQESATGSDPKTQRIGSDGWLPSSRSKPCPVCSRTKDGDCRISADGEQVICHHPKDLAPGTVTNGWAFTKNTSDGRAGHFTIDKPRSRTTPLRSKVVPLRTPAPAAEPAPDPAAITLARLPQAHKQPPAHWPHGQILPYGSDGQQWAKVVVDAKGKRHLPHHIDANGKTISKAGPTPWPLWCEAMALEHGPGKWIVETEGEKCAAWFHAAALVAISQPGHDHKQDKIQARYARLVAAGVAGVVYLADHDKTGSEKAHKCAAAAAAVNLPFVTVPAADVWPGLPAGGSIDDAPGTAADRAAAFNAQLQQRKPKQQAQQAAPAEAPSRFTPRADTAVRWGQRTLSHTRRMACFDRCVEVQAKQERNSLRRRARLLKALHDLKLQKYINRDEIAQRVLEAKDASQGNRFQALTAADRAAMERPVVRYLLPGILPASDASILGGLAKVGKTRLAVAMVAAVLTGQAMFDLPAPTTTKPVVLVTDDQADGDTADMLDALQLWEHPQLVWSRNFRLTEHDLDALLATIAANPGALVVIDSLRSISRNLRHGENDPEIGATLYDLKQAVIDAGGTLLLIHHCNKAQEQVGTEALSGHNAIAGAANTILTLHYLPGENGRPNKTAPERRLFREPRSGEGFDLVISRDGNGSFRKVCTLTQWQQQAQEAKEANKRERVSPMQQQVLEALQEAAPAWLTKRQVCEEIGVEWGDRGRGAEPNQVERALKRLVELAMAESERSGTAASYRALRSGQNEPLTPLTPLTTSDASGSEHLGLSADSADTADNESGTDCQRCQHPSEKSADTETPGGDSLSALSALSAPAWLPQLLAIRAANPTAHASTLVNLLSGQHGISTNVKQVRNLLKQHDRQEPDPSST